MAPDPLLADCVPCSGAGTGSGLLLRPCASCVAVEEVEEGMTGVQYAVTALFSLMGLGVLGAVGLMAYGRWKEKSRKRFY